MGCLYDFRLLKDYEKHNLTMTWDKAFRHKPFLACNILPYSAFVNIFNENQAHFRELVVKEYHNLQKSVITQVIH